MARSHPRMFTTFAAGPQSPGGERGDRRISRPARMFGLRLTRCHAALQQCPIFLFQNPVLLDPLLQNEAVEREHPIELVRRFAAPEVEVPGALRENRVGTTPL